MAKRTVMNAFELVNNQVYNRTYDQVLGIFMNLKAEYRQNKNKFKEEWEQVKDLIEKKGQNIKHQDDMYYYSLTIEPNHYIVFGIGQGKKDTLTSIYVKLKEEETKKDDNNKAEETTTNSNNNPMEQVQTALKNLLDNECKNALREENGKLEILPVHMATNLKNQQKELENLNIDIKVVAKLIQNIKESIENPNFRTLYQNCDQAFDWSTIMKK